MAESNATQVILTDDGIKIINAQSTADNAASGVANLNDPNLMSVIEKQNNVAQFAGLTSQYNVLVQNAKDDGIDTTAVTTAYNNLNRFMADILADPNHASDIDRTRYKKYQDAYNEELAKLQNALQNNTNDKFTSAASAISQAASTANVAKSAANSAYTYANSEIAVQSTATAKAQSAADDAFSQAQVVGSQADSAIAVQSTATVKAQSTADNAFSQATTAIDNGEVTSQAVANLKDGSKLTIAELENGLATKVANSEYASYKIQTASQIAQKVDNGDFSTYQTQTASQIASKVDNGDFSTYKTQTADLIAQKVATKDFSAYQATTAKAISSKVESSDFNTYKTQTDSEISQTVTNAISNISIGGTNLIANSNVPVVLIRPDQNLKYPDWVGRPVFRGLTNGETYTFSALATITSANNSVKQWGIRIFQNTGNHEACKTTLDDGAGKRQSYTFTVPDDDISYDVWVYAGVMGGGNATDKITVNLTQYQLEKGNKATDWAPAPEDLATQSQFTQLSDDMNLRVKKGDLIDQINLQAGNTLISSSGQLTLSAKSVFLDSANPVIMKSANIDKLLVGKKLTAADISANTFTTNNGTFTVNQNGAITAKNMTLIGGTLTSPTINASTINGSTINGTTINTPTLNLGLNGTLATTYNDTQPTRYYNPKKYNGTMNIQAGVFYSSGTDSVYDKTQSAWAGIDDSMGYNKGGTNPFSSEIAPMHLKFDIYGTTNQVLKRSYMDAFGVYVMNGSGTSPTVAITGQGISSTAMISSTMGLQSDKVISNNNFYLNGGHTINSIDGRGIWFESGISSGNHTVHLHASKFSVSTSRISTKRNIELLNDEESNRILNGTDTASFQFLQDSNVDDDSEGVLIDDVNPEKQYSLPVELVQKSGKGPKDLMSFIARLISQNKYQSRLIEDLQIRMREVELANE